MIAFHWCLGDTGCTGKSPDPLYLHAGDSIHPMLRLYVADVFRFNDV